jgi:hypothetical protein
MAGLETDWREKYGADGATPDGLLAGLPSPNSGGSLSLLLDPKDIADINSVPTTVVEGATLGSPVALVSTQHDEIPIAPPGVSVDRNIQRAQDAVGDDWRMPPDPAAYCCDDRAFFTGS